MYLKSQICTSTPFLADIYIAVYIMRYGVPGRPRGASLQYSCCILLLWGVRSYGDNIHDNIHTLDRQMFLVVETSSCESLLVLKLGKNWCEGPAPPSLRPPMKSRIETETGNWYNGVPSGTGTRLTTVSRLCGIASPPPFQLPSIT